MRNGRAWVYVIAACVVACLAAYSPAAWATPDRSPSNQTVPTLAPSPTFKPPTPIVTPAPGPGPTTGPQPSPSPGPGPGTQPGPQVSPSPGPGPQSGPGQQPGPAPASTETAAGALRLTAVVNPTLAWPGARLQFTVTLANAGNQTLDQVVLNEYLSEGLEPEAGGSPYLWDELRHLLVPFGSLGPGQQVVLPFTIIVARDARPGAVLQVVGVATANGVGPASTQTLVPLPPAELPPTGEDLRGAGRGD